MKITQNLPVQKAVNKYTQPVQKAEKASGLKFSPDTIEISEAAREVQVAAKALKNLPEVREDLVNAIKQAIQDGTYKPSSEDIAKKILGR